MLSNSGGTVCAHVYPSALALLLLLLLAADRGFDPSRRNTDACLEYTCVVVAACCPAAARFGLHKGCIWSMHSAWNPGCHMPGALRAGHCS
jgi:hypothetical protein